MGSKKDAVPNSQRLQELIGPKVAEVMADMAEAGITSTALDIELDNGDTYKFCIWKSGSEEDSAFARSYIEAPHAYEPGGAGSDSSH